MALLSILLIGVDLHDELALEYFNLSYSDSLIYNALDNVIKPEVYAYIDSIVEDWFKYTQYWDKAKGEIRSVSISSYRIKRFKVSCLPIIKEHYSIDDLKEINAALATKGDNAINNKLLRGKTDILAETIEVFKTELKKGAKENLTLAWPRDPHNPDKLGERPIIDYFSFGYDKPPKSLGELKPEYPEAARVAGIQGTVVLHVEILRDGSVGDIYVMRSYPVLDEAAKEAVRKLRFQPAFLEDEPVNCMIIIPIEFELDRR
jgi:TonB family protein